MGGHYQKQKWTLQFALGLTLLASNPALSGEAGFTQSDSCAETKRIIQSLWRPLGDVPVDCAQSIPKNLTWHHRSAVCFYQKMLSKRDLEALRDLNDPSISARANNGIYLYQAQGFLENLVQYSAKCIDHKVMNDIESIYESLFHKGTNVGNRIAFYELASKDHGQTWSIKESDFLETVQFALGYFNTQFAWLAYLNKHALEVDQLRFKRHLFDSGKRLLNTILLAARDTNNFQPDQYKFITDRTLQLVATLIRVKSIDDLLRPYQPFLNDREHQEISRILNQWIPVINNHITVRNRALLNGYRAELDLGESWRDYSSHKYSGLIDEEIISQIQYQDSQNDFAIYNPKTRKTDDYSDFRHSSPGSDLSHGWRLTTFFRAFKDSTTITPRVNEAYLLGSRMPLKGNVISRMNIDQLVTAFTHHLTDHSLWVGPRHFRFANYLGGALGPYVQNGVVYEKFQHSSMGVMGGFAYWNRYDETGELHQVLHNTLRLFYTVKGNEPLCKLTRDNNHSPVFVGTHPKTGPSDAAYCNQIFIRADKTHRPKHSPVNFALFAPYSWHADIRFLPLLTELPLEKW